MLLNKDQRSIQKWSNFEEKFSWTYEIRDANKLDGCSRIHTYWTVPAFSLWIDDIIHVELLHKSKIQKYIYIYIYIRVLQISAFSGTELSEPFVRKKLSYQSRKIWSRMIFSLTNVKGSWAISPNDFMTEVLYISFKNQMNLFCQMDHKKY